MTVAAQLERAGVALDAELPVRFRWSVSCHTRTCRFALLHLPTAARARKAAVEHADIHAGHAVEIHADVSLPLRSRGPEPLQDGRSLPDVPADTRQARPVRARETLRVGDGIPDRALHDEVGR